MKGGGGQQQNGSGSMDILWISAFVVLLLGYIWYAHSDTVVQISYNINYYKLLLLEKTLLLVQSFDIINVEDQLASVASDFQSIKGMLGVKTELDTLRDVTILVNKNFAYPYAVCASSYILFLLFVSKSNSFKKKFSMKTLRKQELANWPYPSCVPNNLIKLDINEGPWAMSNQIIPVLINNNLVSQQPVYGEVKLTVHDKKVYDMFVRQMGGYWTGKLDCMPNYAKALFAIFAAKGNGDDKSARKMIEQIAISSGRGKLNFNGSTMLIAKHIRSRGVGMAVSPHAYLLTAMASLLEFARTGGVVAMAEFIWLKKVDRKLWYMLQSVGRQTPFVEVAAVFAHWIVEKRIKRPLKVPVIDQALIAAITAVKEVKYNPDGHR